MISVDGTTGELFRRCRRGGSLAGRDVPGERLDSALAGADEATGELVRSVDRLLRHADSTRRLRVRANADNAEDAAGPESAGPRALGARTSTCSSGTAGN